MLQMDKDQRAASVINMDTSGLSLCDSQSIKPIECNTGSRSNSNMSASKPGNRFQATPVTLERSHSTVSQKSSSSETRPNKLVMPVNTENKMGSSPSRMLGHSQKTGSRLGTLFGAFFHQSNQSKAEQPKRPRTISQNTTQSQSGSLSQWVIITESASIMPNLASVVSLEKTLPDEVQWDHQKPFGDLDETNVSASVQQLEKPDIYDDPDYTDTVKSTDSNSSLRRTFSMPPDYHYRPYRNRKLQHCKEIFADFTPKSEKSSFEDMHDEVEDKQYWKQTMEDLLEQPEYTDTTESTSSRAGLLAKAAREIAMDKKTALAGVRKEDVIDEVDEESDVMLRREKRRYTKNLIVLSISFMCVFTAYLSLRNLQSSLNHEGGLGLYALSSVYGFLFIGCMFATTVVEKLRPKTTMVVMFNGFLLYVLANFYPSYYTLIPVSCVVGCCLAGLWTAHATYLTNMSLRYAEMTAEPLSDVLSHFNGIFFTFFQFAQIIGGIISSVVLMKEPVHHEPNINSSMEIYMENSQLDNLSADLGLDDLSQCGSNFCHSEAVNAFSVNIESRLIYILVGIYTCFAVIGIVLLFTCLDKLEVSNVIIDLE